MSPKIGVASILAAVLPDNPGSVPLSQLVSVTGDCGEPTPAGVGLPMTLRSWAWHVIGYIKRNPASNFVYGLIRLLLISTLVSVSFIYVTPVWSQQQTDFETEKKVAYGLFAHGHLQESAKTLQNLVARAPSKLAAASLERDILEVCSTGFFLTCYYDANKALFASLQSDKELSSLFPDLMLYALRERIWFDDKKFIQQVIDKGGAPSYAAPNLFPATYAQMQLALHTVYVNRNDLKTAEETSAGAIAGLLLSDPNQPYLVCKILIGLLSALLTEQDIVGAFQLLAVIDPYVSKRLSHESMLYADYTQTVGLLFSFSNNIPIAVATLTTAAELYKKLDIAPEIRDYNVGGLNSLSSVALAIEGKLDQAKEMHAHLTDPPISEVEAARHHHLRQPSGPRCGEALFARAVYAASYEISKLGSR